MQNPEAVAWVIATEGSIILKSSYSTSGNSTRPYIQSHISVSNTDPNLIEAFRNMVEYGHTCGPYARGNGCKPHYFWTISSLQNCLSFLTEIAIYLPIKCEQAIIVMDYCERRLSANHGPYTEKDWLQFDAVQALNRKGV